MSSTQYFDKLALNLMTGTSIYSTSLTSTNIDSTTMTGTNIYATSLTLPSLTTTTTSDILYIDGSGSITKGSVPTVSAYTTTYTGGSDQQIIFNSQGDSYTGSSKLTYNYTDNVLISLGDLSLSSRVPHKFYTYTGTTTTSSSRAEITLTFTNSSFISKVTAILKNSSSAGTSVLLLTDIHDASDNIYISSQSESHTSSLTSYIWDMEQNTSTNTTLTFKTTSETTTFDYQILVETTGNGSLSSISDGTVTQSYTF